MIYKHDETTFKQYVKITRNNKEKWMVLYEMFTIVG